MNFLLSAKRLQRSLLLFSVITICGSLQIATADFSDQRELYKKTAEALQKGQMEVFQRGVKELSSLNYPITPYLEYKAHRKSIRKADSASIKGFLEQNQTIPFAYHLRGKWLEELARRKAWGEYLEFFDGRENTQLQCYQFQARLSLNQTNGIIDEIRKIWLRGYSQPDECDPAFAYLLENTNHDKDLIWERIQKAFKSRRPTLARYLSKKLTPSEQDIAALWYRAHTNPEKTLKHIKKTADSVKIRQIAAHALDRLARKKSLIALSQWQELQGKFNFDQSQQDEINQRIALSAAYQHESVAQQLLSDLPERLKTDQAYLWLARIQLRNQDWSELLKTVQAMPDRIKSENEWQYWLARATEKSVSKNDAIPLFRQLALKPSYYGFLAADKVNQNYSITQENVFDQSSLNEEAFLADNPYLLRSRELYFVDQLLDARREWFQALRKMGTKQIKHAATLASRWKWHDNAIKTVAKTAHRSDYNLRFPTPYIDKVMAQAENRALDPSLIYGIMRRESLFDPLARSRVGALGLMQLMPATAKGVAKSLGMKKPGRSDILNIDNNIRLGTHYFSTVMNRFDNNVALAAAAYNAGPGNVKRWLPKEKELPADLWVETVPYNETRHYVQAVLAYATVFDKSFGNKTLISSRMDTIRTTY